MVFDPPGLPAGRGLWARLERGRIPGRDDSKLHSAVPESLRPDAAGVGSSLNLRGKLERSVTMRVAYLTSRYQGVSETFIAREVQALRAHGVEIDTFSVRRPFQDEASTPYLVPPRILSYGLALLVTVVRRPGSFARTLFQTLHRPGTSLAQRFWWLVYFAESVQLAHWLSRGGYTRLHCHFGNAAATTGMLATRLAGIHFSLTCHGTELRYPHRFALAEKVAHADFVVCVSHDGRARLMLECPPADWPKIQVIRCFPAPSETRNGAATATGPPEILCVARMSVEKGHFVLLDALARLAAQGTAFRATLVGTGPLLDQVREHVTQLGLDDCVTAAGSLPFEQVNRLYPSASVVVLSSFSEGVPVTLMEAMAHHLPVVATRVGGVAELVEHGVSGLLVAPGCANELAEALARILADREVGRAMGDAGARRVAEEFNAERSALALFERMKAS